jgi:hypothetical protein
MKIPMFFKAEPLRANDPEIRTGRTFVRSDAPSPASDLEKDISSLSTQLSSENTKSPKEDKDEGYQKYNFH